jgi:L-lactate dehydrogenase complex protein LldF
VTTAAQEFLRNAAEKSADLTRRAALRRSIDHYYAAVARGRARYTDWEAARERCHEIKWEAVNHLDRYLQEFEQRVLDRGGHVYWAANGEEARRYVCDLAAKRGVRTVVKSKSMVTEEIHLAKALEDQQIKVFETDLGEFIVQLRGEPPYHIVTPAMHLTRDDIAVLFREKLGGVTTNDPPELVAAARRALRQAFFSAEMGISGANFLIADAGMIVILTNEGNADLGVSLPRIHVAIAGIEKVLPRMGDLATFLPVLAQAGTGQPITVYNTLIGGPRVANEFAGPDEFHVVLLDNGRTELLADAEQRDILHCIRCGACLNACPVYRTIGGHAYGTTYSGPIGSVLTPHLRGIHEFQHLPFASSLCGACTDACPVKIDLHHHLLHNRRDAVSAHERKWSERAAFGLWRWTMMSAGRYSVVSALAKAAGRVAYSAGLAGTAVDPAKAWNKVHAAPEIPVESFRAKWRKDLSRASGESN